MQLKICNSGNVQIPPNLTFGWFKRLQHGPIDAQKKNVMSFMSPWCPICPLLEWTHLKLSSSFVSNVNYIKEIIAQTPISYQCAWGARDLWHLCKVTHCEGENTMNYVLSWTCPFFLYLFGIENDICRNHINRVGPHWNEATLNLDGDFCFFGLIEVYSSSIMDEFNFYIT